MYNVSYIRRNALSTNTESTSPYEAQVILYAVISTVTIYDVEWLPLFMYFLVLQLLSLSFSMITEVLITHPVSFTAMYAGQSHDNQMRP